MTDDKRPNVLLITVDQWHGRLLGCAGHPVLSTPTLDELATYGVRFTRAYSESPICIPARRSLMMGTCARTHGDREYHEGEPMPAGVPTLARCFRDAGYQTSAIGKLHVYPQRDRIGFDDVLLSEDGRSQWAVVDDYELFLGDRGFAGQLFATGMASNDYMVRPWHLPDDCHPTTWATRAMTRAIQRRDPTRPALWYLSYMHPHPPMWPLRDYFDRYLAREIASPTWGAWARDDATTPASVRGRRRQGARLRKRDEIEALAAFYALCTHIDHELRVVFGTLREEGLLDRTIICFTSDHGDMLGTHGIWAKGIMYEPAANIPMILAGPRALVPEERVDDRLVALQDVMPTLLELCGIAVPATVEGRSMLTGNRRDHLYGEIFEGARATRMVHDGRHKLIYHAAGNRTQLFDLEADPDESCDLAPRPECAPLLEKLVALLIAELYGSDLAWVDGRRLVGTGLLPPEGPTRSFHGQRGSHWPPPPAR
jgi:arylsulfatase